MKVCAICGKGSRMGGTRRKLRGKYNPVNWSRKYPNLQWARVGPDFLKKNRGSSIPKGNRDVRVKVCTQCMKTLARKAEKAAV